MYKDIILFKNLTGQGVLQQYAEYDIWGGLNAGAESQAGSGSRGNGAFLPGLEENLRFTSYRYDPVIGKYFAQARFYDGANGRVLGKDPVKRGLNPYRYCDDDPVDYVDPTGEILNIIGGAVLGGVFGGAGGLISSAISQKISGGKVDWKEAWGAAANGAITGAAQGGLLASGAGIPVALATNFLAGTAGSAAEQYISTGRVDTRNSITNGLNNAVSNLIYGTNPLGSVKEAFGRGFGAGAATSAINYISDLIGQKPVGSGVNAELLSGITGAAVSPFAAMRDPRRGCGSASPFTFSLGYSTAKGYRYDTPQTTNQPQSQRRGFSLKAFLGETLLGGLTGGFTSAAFYGAGKGIERLVEGFRSNKSGRYTVGDAAFMDTDDTFLSYISRRKDVDPNGYYDIVAHDTPKGMQITHNGRHIIVNHRTAARLIQNLDGYNGQPIRLLSCNTGSLDNGFAQNLANKLNVDVVAPTNYLWARQNGSYFIAGLDNSKLPKMLPDMNNIGFFKSFTPGGNH